MNYHLAASLVRTVGVAILGMGAALASATTWPQKPIQIIHAAPPGATMDALARIVGDELGSALKQPVVVQSKQGAGGSIAAEQVIHATADGYTLLFGTGAQFVITPHLQKTRFNSLTDLRHISMVATGQNMLVVRPGLPVQTLGDLVALARKNPGKLNYGSSGSGTMQHLGGELFQQMTGTKITHVAYKGGAPARIDLLAGTIDLMFGDLAAIPLVKEGKLRALAVTGSSRESSVPDVPTMEEAGLKGYTLEGYFLLSAPRETPDEVTKKITEVMAAALQRPDFIKRIEGASMRPASDVSSKYLNETMAREFRDYGRLIQDAGIKVD